MRPTASLVVALLLSACVGPSGSVSIDESSDGGPLHAEVGLSCPDTATLSVAVQVGNGTVTVLVLDGDGAEAFREDYEAPDGGEAERGLFGATGTWTLRVVSSGFEGRVDATLSC